MAFILKRHTRLFYNLVRYKQSSASLLARKNRSILVECPKLIKFNDLRIRTVTAAAEKQAEYDINFPENVENMMRELKFGVDEKMVLKEDIQKLLNTLKEHGEMTHQQLSVLLKSCTGVSVMCSKTERIRMAKDVWECAKKFGLKLDTSYYNELLMVFRENYYRFSVKNFLTNMKADGVEPDKMTYQLLLRIASQQSNIEAVKDLLGEMKNLDYPLSGRDFDSLILAYSNTGDFEKAKEVLNIMEEKEISPSSWSYVHLLSGYIKHGELEKFKELFDECCERNNFFVIHFLEILHALGVKNHSDLIDMVLEKFPKKRYYERLAAGCIHRLLHERLDSIALKLIESVDMSNKDFNSAPLISRHMLNHFILYRQPKEILDTCEKLEEKGCASDAVAYCLRKIFFSKDEYFALKFINEMKNRNIPVRTHYYWPIIIKASTKGNNQLVAILKELPKWVVNNNETTYDVILPKYTFSDNWEMDLAKLLMLRLNEMWTARFLITEFLRNGQIDNIEKITASHRVRVFGLSKILEGLFLFLKKNPDKVNQVVNILYQLNHDVHLESAVKKTEDPEELDQSTSKSFKYGDAVVARLLQDIKNEKLILSVLEALLEKKIGITPETGSLIAKSLPNQNVDELVSRLSDPNLKIDLSVELLTNKTNSHKNALQFINSISSLKDCVNAMITLANNNDIDSAIEVGENFLQHKKERATLRQKRTIKKLYKDFLNDVFYRNNDKMIAKCLDLGVKFGILNERDYYALFIIHHLQRNDISKAINKLKESLVEHGLVVVCFDILVKCISEDKTEALQEITELVSGTINRNVALTHLMIAFAICNKMEKAREILDTPGFMPDKQLILLKLSNIQQIPVLKNFLEMFKNLVGYDDVITSLYKQLALKYAEEKQVENIQKLCAEVEKSTIIDYNFLTLLSKFQQDSDIISLYNSLKASRSVPHQDNYGKIDFLNRIFEKEKTFQASMNDSLSHTEAANLARKLASQGMADKAHLVVEKYSLEGQINQIGNAFLTFDKVKEFFQFLDLLMSKGDFTSVSKCLRVNRLISVLAENDEHFKKYKQLSLQCATSTNNSTPVISCFVTCVKLPGKLKDAEEIFTEYADHFKDLPFSKLRECVEAEDFVSNFYENVLFNDTLKRHFSDQLPAFYNNVISVKCKENNLDHALSYLELAKSDKVDNMLDKNVINELEKKCKTLGL